jgi:hypothetical protein
MLDLKLASALTLVNPSIGRTIFVIDVSDAWIRCSYAQASPPPQGTRQSSI